MKFLFLFVSLAAFAEHTPTKAPADSGRAGTGPKSIPSAACYQTRDTTLKEYDDNQACLDSLKDGNKDCAKKAKSDCERKENKDKDCIYVHTRYPNDYAGCEVGKEKKFAAICRWYCTDIK